MGIGEWVRGRLAGLSQRKRSAIFETVHSYYVQ